MSRVLSKDAGVEDTHTKQSVKERFGVDPDESPLSAKEWLERRLKATYHGRKESR